MVNTVNEENFNDTMKGYVIGALRIVEATDARKEYEAYCQRKITFPVKVN